MLAHKASPRHFLPWKSHRPPQGGLRGYADYLPTMVLPKVLRTFSDVFTEKEQSLPAEATPGFETRHHF